MSTTIEQLELEVKSDSSSAIKSLDALSTSLSKLKSATKGGIGLNAVAKQLTNLNTALNGVNGESAQKLTDLSTSLQKLSTLSNIKISSSISNQIKNLGSAISTLDGVNFTNVSQLANVVTPLTLLGKSNLGTFINQLKKIPEVVKALDDTTITQFTNKISQLASTLAPLATQITNIGNAFSKLPVQIRQTTTATNSLKSANVETSKSYVNLWSRLSMAYVAMRGISTTIATCITEANEYIEDINLFTVSMGDYANQAQKYAEAVSEAVGIDPGEFMRNQGIFNTIIKGFGVATDRAYIMSQNLTQLGYDIASFYNISFENAMQKIQSGISGELEPLRRLGYDLSVARLQQEAYTLGITKSVSAMTQAEKSELRYYAIMTQVTDAQGDMARTLNAPANQLRVLQSQVTQCARAFGNVFLPVLSAVLPYLIAAAKAIRYLADCVASLFGFKLADFTASLSDTSSSVGGLADSASDVADNLSDATAAAKKLKNATVGIDELNIISPDSSSSGGSGTSDLGGGGLGIDLPTYDFLDGLVESKVNAIFEEMKKHLKEIAEIVITIGAALAAWKIAKSVLEFFKMMESFKGFNMSTGLLGLTLLFADMNEFRKYLDDFISNGASFQNVAGMISEFAGMLGDAFILLGNVKLGGALKVVQGVGEIVVAIKDISDNGVNWSNVSTTIRGISNIAIGLGLVTGNFKLAGIGVVLQGLLNVIPQLKNVITAIKTGDWSVVDWSDLVIGAIEVIAGIALALGAFKGLTAVSSMTKASTVISEVTTATTSANTAVGALNGASVGFSSTLANLATNLLLGIAIIAEVAVAAALIIGTIALLGAELQLVNEAWSPAIENAETVAIAVGVGTVMLVAVGAATALLGTLGGAVCAQLGIGIAVLAEMSVTTDLFLAEIIIIGALLNKVGEAWQPVLNNGETIASGIGIGTALLVGIGVVTVALGMATVGTAGLLPVAIGLGTALLVELAAAFVLFCESLVKVADELSNNLAPELQQLNGNLPTLTTNMSNFVTFMTSFADKVVQYTKVNAIAGLSATIDTIVGWFTEDPIDKLANDVNEIYEQTKGLNEKLQLAVPELKTAHSLLTSYQNFLAKIEAITSSGNVELSTGLFVNMKEVGQNLVTGFVEGIKSKSSEFSNAATTLVTGFKTALTSKVNECQSSMITWAKNLKSWFSSKSFGGICAETWQTYAKNIVDGFRTGIVTYYVNCKSSLTTWGNNIKKWFYYPNGTSLYNEFVTMGKNVIQGFINGASDSTLWSIATAKIYQFGQAVIQAGRRGLDEASPSKAFKQIGAFVIEGFNIGLSSVMDTSFAIMDDFTNGICAYSPTLALAVDTSQLSSVNNVPSVNRAVVADVQSSYSVINDGFTDNMETFYRDYIESTIKEMANDIKRQADKSEQTIVKVGNRTVTDAVTTQKKANGYAFVR